MFGNGADAAPDLIDKGKDRAVLGQQVKNIRAHQAGAAGGEHLFGGGVGEQHPVVFAHHQNGQGQGVENVSGLDTHRACLRVGF